MGLSAMLGIWQEWWAAGKKKLNSHWAMAWHVRASMPDGFKFRFFD